MHIDPASRTPLADQAYEILRGKILQGTLQAGAKLKIDELQREHRISSSPLREALNRLVAENLVIASERRGFRAAPVTRSDLMDLTNARLTVEVGAFAASIRAGTDEWEAGIVAAYHRLELVESRVAAGQTKRGEEWTARHKEFHIALLAACGSQRLIDMCALLFDQSERYRRMSAALRLKPRDTGKEHRQLMQSALRREARAANLLRVHIEKTAEHVIGALE